MAVTAPDDAQWAAMVAAITANVAAVTALTAAFVDFNSNIASEMLKMARCDRLENNLSIGPPAFDPAGCSCDADVPNPTVFWEEEEGECCTPLASPSPDVPVSPPKCTYVEDGTPVGPGDQLGLPAGLELGRSRMSVLRPPGSCA